MLRLFLLLLSTSALAYVPKSRSGQSPAPGEEVAEACGVTFELNDDEEPDVEFSSVLGTTDECKYYINTPKDMHADVSCAALSGSVTANGQAADNFCGDGPVEIVFTPSGAEDQVFCYAALHELHRDPAALQGENGVDSDIKSFEQAYGVEFKDPEDEALHAEILSDNEQKIRDHNADRSNSYSLGVTSLAHLTIDEVVNEYTGKDGVPTEEEMVRRTERAERELLGPLRMERQTLPASVDLTTTGAVSTPKNQGRCGSCSVFAAVSTVETCVFKVTNTLPNDLSEQSMLDCAYGIGGNGCNGGSADRYHEWMYTRNSPFRGMLAQETAYPYTASTSGNCQTRAKASVGAVVSSHQESWRSSEEDIMRLLAQGHSVTTGMRVINGFYLLRGGIYDDPNCCDWRNADGSVNRSKCPGQNHDITIVGYGEENGKKYWKIKNSWGTGWGVNGFAKYKRGTGHCGLGVDFSVPICTASGPAPTPTPTPTPTPSPPAPTDACNVTLTAASGEISSPNYPNKYANKQHCTYEFNVPDSRSGNNVLKFTVEDLDIERGSSRCPYDYLLFQNGDGTNMQVGNAGKLCGTTKPSSIVSKDLTSKLTFHTDYSVTKKGFKLKYERVPNPSCTGRTLSTHVGIQPVAFQSPNYPSNYPINKDCDWTITVNDGEVVNLMFDDFETEYYYDTVKVYDGTRSGRLLGSFSGSRKPATVRSTGKTMTVVFKSDYSITKKGFKAAASASAA